MYKFFISILLATIVFAFISRCISNNQENKIFIKIRQYINFDNIYVWLISAIVCIIIISIVRMYIGNKYGRIEFKYYIWIGTLVGIFFKWKLRKNKE